MPTTTIVMLPVYDQVDYTKTVGPGDGLTYAYVGQTVNLADNINSTPPSVNRFTGYLNSFVNTGNPSFTANFTFDITDPTDLRSISEFSSGIPLDPTVYSRVSGRYVLVANYATSDGSHTLKFRGFFECLKSYAVPPVPVPEGTRTASMTLRLTGTAGNNNGYAQLFYSDMRTVQNYSSGFVNLPRITDQAIDVANPPATITDTLTYGNYGVYRYSKGYVYTAYGVSHYAQYEGTFTDYAPPLSPVPLAPRCLGDPVITVSGKAIEGRSDAPFTAASAIDSTGQPHATFISLPPVLNTRVGIPFDPTCSKLTNGSPGNSDNYDKIGILQQADYNPNAPPARRGHAPGAKGGYEAYLALLATPPGPMQRARGGEWYWSSPGGLPSPVSMAYLSSNPFYIGSMGQPITSTNNGTDTNADMGGKAGGYDSSIGPGSNDLIQYNENPAYYKNAWSYQTELTGTVLFRPGHPEDLAVVFNTYQYYVTADDMGDLPLRYIAPANVSYGTADSRIKRVSKQLYAALYLSYGVNTHLPNLFLAWDGVVRVTSAILTTPAAAAVGYDPGFFSLRPIVAVTPTVIGGVATVNQCDMGAGHFDLIAKAQANVQIEFFQRVPASYAGQKDGFVPSPAFSLQGATVTYSVRFADKTSAVLLSGVTDASGNTPLQIVDYWLGYPTPTLPDLAPISTEIKITLPNGPLLYNGYPTPITMHGETLSSLQATGTPAGLDTIGVEIPGSVYRLVMLYATGPVSGVTAAPLVSGNWTCQQPCDTRWNITLGLYDSRQDHPASALRRSCLSAPTSRYCRAEDITAGTPPKPAGIGFWRAGYPVPKLMLNASGVPTLWEIAGVPVTSLATDTSPSLTADIRGALYCAFARQGAGAFVRRSDDMGTTWGTETLMIPGGQLPAIASANGAMLAAAITGTAQSGYSLMTAYKAAGDRVFSAPVVAVYAPLPLTQPPHYAPLVPQFSGIALCQAAEGPGRWILSLLVKGEAATSEWWSSDNGVSFTRIPTA